MQISYDFRIIDKWIHATNELFKISSLYHNNDNCSADEYNINEKERVILDGGLLRTKVVIVRSSMMAANLFVDVILYFGLIVEGEWRG